ncbi:MAG: hypothetical protein O2816_05065 [Planctomycetota bacterium]|nr:hypothetical protein [Planctomycetota bacterium]
MREGLLREVDLGEERAAWLWLFNYVEAYPSDGFMAPLKPPKRDDKPRRLIVCDLDPTAEDYTPDAKLRAVRWCDGVDVHVIDQGSPEELGEQFAQSMLTHRTRGHLIAFWRGADYAFHVILRTWARGLLGAGYTVQPLAAGASLRALIIRRGGHSWMLCDVGTMTGLTGVELGDFLRTFAPKYRLRLDVLMALWSALRSYQRTTLDLFGAHLSPTVSRSAVRAATRTLGFYEWLWRPSPLLVAMCRTGAAYRGGYAFAHRFEGQAYRADIRKAYTAALEADLPRRAALGSAGIWPHERPGLYLTHIRGPGRAPIYIGKWTGFEGGFEALYWNGGEALAFVPTSEYAGLRRLGYRVEGGWGFTWSRTFGFRRFVQQIRELLSTAEPGSQRETVAKLFGVSVYGKLAERPERTDVMMALERPGDDWRPYTDEIGVEVPFLWERHHTVHRAHQHVDVAAVITGKVRGQLYSAIADVLDAGGDVPHADTDGLLSTIDPRGVLPEDGGELGDWRLDPGPADAAVWGHKAYAFGEDVRVAGMRGLSRDDARRLAQGESMVVEWTQTRGAPWSAPLREPLRRTARPTA